MKVSWWSSWGNHWWFMWTLMMIIIGLSWSYHEDECFLILYLLKKSHDRLMKIFMKWSWMEFQTLMIVSWWFGHKNSFDIHETHMNGSWFFEKKIMRGSFAHEDFIRFIRSWVSWTFHESHECLMNESLMNNSCNIHDSFMKYS